MLGGELGSAGRCAARKDGAGATLAAGRCSAGQGRVGAQRLACTGCWARCGVGMLATAHPWPLAICRTGEQLLFLAFRPSWAATQASTDHRNTQCIPCPTKLPSFRQRTLTQLGLGPSHGLPGRLCGASRHLPNLLLGSPHRLGGTLPSPLQALGGHPLDVAEAPAGGRGAADKIYSCLQNPLRNAGHPVLIAEASAGRRGRQTKGCVTNAVHRPSEEVPPERMLENGNSVTGAAAGIALYLRVPRKELAAAWSCPIPATTALLTGQMLSACPAIELRASGARRLCAGMMPPCATRQLDMLSRQAGRQPARLCHVQSWTQPLARCIWAWQHMCHLLLPG